MPIHLKEPQFLVRGAGAKRRVTLLGLKSESSADVPTLKISDSFGTERAGRFILERFLAKGNVPSVSFRRLVDELADLKLPRGSYIELCAECGKHGSIRLGKTTLGDFDCRQDARRIAKHLEGQQGVSHEVRIHIEEDIRDCSLPERPTKSQHPDSELFAGVSEALKMLDGLWRAVQGGARVMDLHERHRRRTAKP